MTSVRFVVKGCRLALASALAVLMACESSSDGRASARSEAKSYAREEIPCTSDADCCVVIDGCLGQALIVGAADKEKVASLVSQPDPGGCVGCIPPAIQVTCTNGRCSGVAVDPIDAGAVSLYKDHCGSIGVAAPASSARSAPVSGCGVH